jgi:hypothetical protein
MCWGLAGAMACGAKENARVPVLQELRRSGRLRKPVEINPSGAPQILRTSPGFFKSRDSRVKHWRN